MGRVPVELPFLCLHSYPAQGTYAACPGAVLALSPSCELHLPARTRLPSPLPSPPPAYRLCLFYFVHLLPTPLLLFSPPLPLIHHHFFLTKIRISGHILCSFPQVRLALFTPPPPPPPPPPLTPHGSLVLTCLHLSFGVTSSPAHCKSLTFTTQYVGFSSLPAYSPSPLAPLLTLHASPHTSPIEKREKNTKLITSHRATFFSASQSACPASTV